MKSDKAIKRTVLVILKNRFNPSEKVRFVEIQCDAKGSILEEKLLRSEPLEARFDEVWQNDEGKQSVGHCNRFKRFYRHALEKKA